MAHNKSSKAWIHQHINDPYVKQATAEGMRSRAAYKLMQIDDKDKLLKRGMTVVDLGAAPGGWSQVAARRVAPGGRVIAIDLQNMLELPYVRFIRGDFARAEGLAAIEAELAGAPVDLVLSDMAPNISGIALTDQLRLIELTELALEFAVKHLKPQGNFLVKVFHGAGFDGFVKAMRAAFVTVGSRKPLASRKGSREVYLLGKALKKC